MVSRVFGKRKSVRILADAALDAEEHLRDGQSDQDAVRADEEISIRFDHGEDCKRSGSPIRDDLVRRSRAVEVLGERAPRHGLRVERLDLLAGPDVRALGVEQDFALIRNDLLHYDELQNCADDRAEDLYGQTSDRGKFCVLRELQIAREGEALRARVVAVEREVCEEGRPCSVLYAPTPTCSAFASYAWQAARGEGGAA